MKQKTIVIIIAAALVALLLGAWIGYKLLPKIYAPEEQELPTQNASTASDFTVLDEKGRAVRLSDHFGKPIVLNFWATWCGPCQMEMPAFDKLAKTYGGEVTFMMVNLTDGSRDTVEGAKKFIEESGYTFPLYFDTTLAAANTYQAYSIPMTVFINARGEVVQSYTGAMSESTLEHYIKNIL